eukprot:sb/3465044/
MDVVTISLIRILAITDLLGGIVLYPNFIYLLSTGRFPFPPEYCLVLGFFEIYFPLCSTQIVMYLVVTKVIMIKNPFLVMRSDSSSNINHWMIPMFIYGAIVPAGPFFGMSMFMFSPERGTCTFQFHPPILPHKLWIMICTTLFVIVPLIVVVITSIYIIHYVRKKQAQFANSKASKVKKDEFQLLPVNINTGILIIQHEITSKQNSIKRFLTPPTRQAKDQQTGSVREHLLKTVFVVLLVVVAYIVCWSMFFVVTTVAFFVGGEEVIPRVNNFLNPVMVLLPTLTIPSLIRSILLWQKALLMTNNAANPIVYVLGNKKIQGVLRNLWRKLRRKPTENLQSQGGLFTITDKSPIFTPRLAKRKTILKTNTTYRLPLVKPLWRRQPHQMGYGAAIQCETKRSLYCTVIELLNVYFLLTVEC